MFQQRSPALHQIERKLLLFISVFHTCRSGYLSVVHPVVHVAHGAFIFSNLDLQSVMEGNALSDISTVSNANLSWPRTTVNLTCFPKYLLPSGWPLLISTRKISLEWVQIYSVEQASSV